MKPIQDSRFTIHDAAPPCDLIVTRHAVRRLRERVFPYFTPTKCASLIPAILRGIDTVRRDEHGILLINRSKNVGFIIKQNIIVTSIKIGA